MWPADIEALQAKLNDVKDGGRPFFYMEVIDQCEYLESLEGVTIASLSLLRVIERGS